MAGKEDACPKSERAEAVDHGVLEAVAAVDDPPLAAAAAEEAAVAVAVDSDSDSDSDSEIINWVEMPLSTLRWVLARKRESDPVPTLEDHGIYTEEDLERKDADMLIRRTIASLQSAHDEFFEFQAWVREVFLRNGRVMVPEDFVGPKDQLQEALDEDWGDGIPSVGDDDPEPEASDTTAALIPAATRC